MSEIAESFASSLSELTVNSKPHINMLTMLADDHLEYAPIITQTVLNHLQKVSPEIKLPVLYLIDSIVKNVGKAYINLFTQNIVQCFTTTFEKVDEKTREQMFKLRQTWSDVFPQKIIYALDAKVHQIDPAWPLSAPPSTVHLNPKFFKSDILESKSITPSIKQPEMAHIESRSHHRKNKTYSSRNHVSHSSRSKKTTPTTTSGGVESSSAAPTLPPKPSTTPEQLREQMIMKQKMLLELQQQKLKLELLQTQAQLEEQQKQLERHNVNNKASQELSKLQQLLKQEEEKLKLMSKNLKKHQQKFPNRQHIVRVTSDMKAHKVTDLSKVSAAMPESLVKPAALLELNKEDKPKTSAKSTSRPRIAPPLALTEKQKIITSADSTEDVAPPVRIAPVSSQLINAALSFGRNVRDPRIRQMSSRLESQLTPGPTTTSTSHPPGTHEPPVSAGHARDNNSDNSLKPDSKSFDKRGRDRKSSNNHRERSSKHAEEVSKSLSKSSSRGSDKTSSRSKEKDKDKASPRKSERIVVHSISSSRRAKIEELFDSCSKSPTDTKTISSSVSHSPSKSHSNRDQNSRTDFPEPSTKSSPKRIKFLELSTEKRNIPNDDSLNLSKETHKLLADTTKNKVIKQPEITSSNVSPEPIDSSAEMMDEDIEKIVRHPGFSKLKNKENKSNTFELEEDEPLDSSKMSEESIEDKFEDIVKYPNKQLKFDKKINEEKMKPKVATFTSAIIEKTDDVESRKEVSQVSESYVPIKEQISKGDHLTESFSSEKPSASEDADPVILPVQTSVASESIIQRDFQVVPTPSETESYKMGLGSHIANEFEPSSKSMENNEVSSTINLFSGLQHDIHESFIQEEVVSTDNVPIETNDSVSVDMQESKQLQQGESVTESQMCVDSKSESMEFESLSTVKTTERLTISPKKIMSPVRNIEPMETIVETNENVPSVGESVPPKKSERRQDYSPVQQEKKPKKNEKPSLMEQAIADAERHEASPSPPPPPVISDKFKEIKQSSLSRLRRVGRSREDLTGQESPEHVDVDLRTQIPPSLPPLTKDVKNEVIGLAEKDVDLRNLPASPSKKRPSMEKLLDIPPAKKPKAEGIDGWAWQVAKSPACKIRYYPARPDPAHWYNNSRIYIYKRLFGSEDVDYRPKLLPVPSPPPPPIISTSPPLEGDRPWARYKQTKPDTYKKSHTPSRRDRAPSVDKFGRHNRLHSSSDGRWGSGGRVRSTEDVDMRAIPMNSKDDHYRYVLKAALQQHQRGELTSIEYQTLINEVMLKKEKEQLDEVKKRDEEAKKREEEEKKREEEAQAELEPISDDDISGGSLSGVEDAPSPPESYSGGEDVDETCFKKAKREERPKVPDEPTKDIDIRLAPADVDIRTKPYHSSYDMSEKSSDEKTSRKTRGVSPYSRRSEIDAEKEKFRRHRDEVRAQRRERKAKRLEEEKRVEHYRQQSRYGQEAWIPPAPDPVEEMEMDGVPRVPPLPPYIHPPQHDSSSQGPPVRPPLWDPQRMPAPGPGPTPGPGLTPWMPGMPPAVRGPPVPMVLRPPQDRFMPPRWHQPGPGPVFEGEPGPRPRFNRFGPPPIGRFPLPTLGLCEVPPTDQAVLKAIDEDPTRSINIDGIPRDIRFYGITAVALMSNFDPREISFQPGSRRVIIDDRDSVVVHFGGPPVEMIIDGQPRRIRFGAPTRELFIDNQWFEVFFGGPPVPCNIAGKMHIVQLEGPAPNVKPGASRTDLVVGKIRLIIDAELFFTIYLDAKPQKFEVKGVGYIIRFVEALQKTVINGVPFTSDFGGLPRPIILNGTKHYFKLSPLPQGITPGFMTIANMEGGRLPSPPIMPAPPQLPASLEQAVLVPPMVTAPPRRSPEVRDRDRDVESGTLPLPGPTITSSAPLVTTQPPLSLPVVASAALNPLDMLTTLLPTEQGRPHTNYSYSVDNENSDQAQDVNSTSTAPAGGSASVLGAGDINVTELLQKLMATGIVPSLEPPKDKGQDKPHTTDSTLIKPVDFRKPETLKTRQTMLIAHLYSGIQCNSCGVRFPPEQTMKYSQHLDWHFRQNRRDKDSSRTAQTRRYYYDVSDWIQFEEIEDLEERAQPWFEMQDGVGEEEEPERVVVSVRAADYPDEAACNICHDKFESFYNEEKEEWHLRNAADHEGKLVHPLCLEDQRVAAEKPIVLDDIDITEDEPKEEENKKEVEEKKDKESPKEEEDDDIMEVTDIEYIKPVFPVEDLTVSDTEDNDEKEKPNADKVNLDEKKTDDEISEEVTSTTNEMEETPRDETVEEALQDDEEPKGANTEPETQGDEDTQDDVLVMEKGEEDSLLSNAEIMEVVRNIKKDPDALGGEYEESGLDPDIKKEKGEIPLPAPVVDTTHATVTCLIDGNVEFEEPAQMVVSGPPKIKINISKAVQPAPKEKEVKEDEVKEDEATEAPVDISISNPMASSLTLNFQPPPPGEEPVPVRVKDKIKSRKMVDLPMVMKDKEMSGLCSIM